MPLKPLQKGERGQLGGSAPLAARGVGIETKSKNFGDAPQGGQFQNQGVRKQEKNLGTQQKTFQQQGGTPKTFQPKDNSQNQIRSQGVEQYKEKTFQQQGGTPKTFQPKDNSQNQIRSQGIQQQNLQQKTIQQQGGQGTQQHIQQQPVQPRVQQQPVQPRVQQQPVQQKAPPAKDDKPKPVQ